MRKEGQKLAREESIEEGAVFQGKKETFNSDLQRKRRAGQGGKRVGTDSTQDKSTGITSAYNNEGRKNVKALVSFLKQKL